MILRRVNELALNPGMNIQDGMLTTHSERTYLAPEAEFLREFLGGARRHDRLPDTRSARALRPGSPPPSGDDGPEESRCCSGPSRTRSTT